VAWPLQILAQANELLTTKVIGQGNFHRTFMAKELVVNQTHSESRIALIENGEILDFLIERQSLKNESSPIVGNIYLGRVLRVLPGMQSAFIDIGQERAAFLYVDDAYLPTIEEQREMQSRIDATESATKRLGEIIPDEFSTLTETVDMKFRPDVKIQDFLKEGDEIVVQIAKEPISTKGPRVTRHITLAGRHIVYMPFIEHTGVSRRIESEEERKRLKDILDSVRPEGVGIIARTVAEGQSYKVLKNDYNNLVKIWKDVQKKMEKAKAPVELHQDLSFIQRALRDIMDEDVDNLVADSKSSVKQIEKFIQRFIPHHKAKIKFYDGETPIFEHYGIDIEIERALSTALILKLSVLFQTRYSLNLVDQSTLTRRKPLYQSM
jgi:ribonuclease G